MVVYQYDGGRTFRDGLAKNFARMYQRGIQQAPCDEYIALQPMLGVKDGHMELLDRSLLQAGGEDGRDVARSTKWHAGLPGLTRHPTAEFERGVNRGGARPSHTTAFHVSSSRSCAPLAGGPTCSSITAPRATLTI